MYFLFISIFEEFVDKFMYSKLRARVGESHSSGLDSPHRAPGDLDSGPVLTSSNHQHKLTNVFSAT